MVSLEAVPWKKNRQWLDLLARSGTPLFISATPSALGPEQERELRDALSLAAVPHPVPEPLDWLETPIRSRWRLMETEVSYDWA